MCLQLGGVFFGSISNDCHSNTQNFAFGSWLAGLLEGDGHFSVPFNKTPQIIISFCIKDLPLCRWLKEKLGTGSIQILPTHCRLTISSLAGLHLIITLINGHMRTGKYHMFTKLVHALSQRTGTEYHILPICTAPIWTSAWLAGFIDADGNFFVGISTILAKTFFLSTIFRLSQALFTSRGFSNLPVMASVAHFLDCYLRINNKIFIVVSASFSSVTILSSYLSKYPLMSAKYHDYSDFIKVHNMIKNKTARKQIDEVRAIKAGMNNGRTVVTSWEHLKTKSYDSISALLKNMDLIDPRLSILLQLF